MKKIITILLIVFTYTTIIFGQEVGYAEEYTLDSSDFITYLAPSFEYKNMNFAIISEEDATVAIMPRIPVFIRPYFHEKGDMDHARTYKSRELPEDFKIPATITHKDKEYVVTAICYGAFANCTDLVKVTIPASIRYIASDAFFGCKSLREVKINGFPYIGVPFSNCTALESLDLSRCKSTSIIASSLPSLKRLTVRLYPGCTISISNLPKLEKLCFYNETDNFEYSVNFLYVDPDFYDRVTLYLRASGSVSAGIKAKFKHIDWLSNSAYAPAIDLEPEQYFDLNGMPVDEPGNGIYIHTGGGKAAYKVMH